MLIKFSVENFLSFKKEATFSMEARSIKEHKEENVFSAGLLRTELLKSAAIYGHDASGKSNLINALSFMINFMKNSSKESQASEKIPVTYFKLSTATENKPSKFEILFVVDDLTYKYGFTVDSEQVHEEYLYYTKKHTEQKLFSRKDNNIEINDDKFVEGNEIKHKGMLRENALLLSLAAQLNGSISTSIINKISNFIFIGDTLSKISTTANLLNNEIYRKPILDLISSAGLGIINVDIKSEKITKDLFEGLPQAVRDYLYSQSKDDSVYTIRTEHIKFDENDNPVGTTFFSLQEESMGTQKFFSLAGPIVDALLNGKVLVIDELTARMHPMLAKMIIKTFNSKTNNPQNAQIIFATHNTYLMDSQLFRRDQIVITQKNKSNSTKITTLLEMDIRSDASFEKKYFEKFMEPVEEYKFQNSDNVNT